jgi:hypothetical protein
VKRVGCSWWVESKVEENPQKIRGIILEIPSKPQKIRGR